MRILNPDLSFLSSETVQLNGRVCIFDSSFMKQVKELYVPIMQVGEEVERALAKFAPPKVGVRYATEFVLLIFRIYPEPFGAPIFQ